MIDYVKPWASAEDHPTNLLPPKAKKLVYEFFNKIPSSGPSEMYKVQTEREDIMVYLPYEYINDLVWELATKLVSLTPPRKVKK